MLKAHMRLTRKQHIQTLNGKFDRAHYIAKKKRSLSGLLRMLLYLSGQYKEQIRQLQKDFYILENRKLNIKKNELVACSIAAKSKKVGVFGTSFKVLKKSDYHDSILNALKPLGSLGGLSNIHKKNAIGKCAEVKAANNILKLDKKAKISEIEFTTAIRPRTSEKINRCTNCIKTFGHE